MKSCLLAFLVMILPTIVSAESNVSKKENSNEITMSVVDSIRLAGDLVERGDFENAETILTQLPRMKNQELEIERWFLMGQISARRGDYDTAIKIFKKLLDTHPDLARIRFELAVCYMRMGRWYRADHHLRLAMAGDDLPDEIRKLMNYYRYIIRQNKNWNVWFNFGAAPDNNVNTANGGTECVNTIFGPTCYQLSEPESAVGFNFTLGGNYEFKFGEHWRWKSDANIYSNLYNKHKFDDLYLTASTGPRYVWQRGDTWLAGIVSRRWYGWDEYSWAIGGKLETNYDFTRKLSAGLTLRFLNNKYDDYGEYLDGDTYAVNGRISYSLDATKYVILRGGIERETAKNEQFANWRPSVGVGFGMALPWGFDIYLEPAFYWTKYDAKRWVVYDHNIQQHHVNDFTQRYSVSVSNHKVDIWGFVPTLTFSYTRRDSNIWQREYDRYAAEFTFQQRF